NFLLNDFQIFINNKKYDVKGTSIRVLNKKNQKLKSDNKLTEEGFSTVKPDIFFSITKSKSQVFVSEGVRLDVSFYINESNRAEINFVNLQNQLDNIIKNIRGYKH